MYRLLEVGEVIENGDEYYGIEDKWLGFPPACVGMKTVPHDAPIRRLVKGCKSTAVTPAATGVPDPGDGWRLLSDGETIQKDDQITTTGHRWDDVSSGIGKKIDPEYSGNGKWSWRRRVAPVVSVGDRVKVLSGPWAGCTGVVIGSLPMNLKIKMDNVFVGGNNLTMIVGKVAVEPLPPVVPEVLYRDLAIGETVKVGDQFWIFGFGSWTDAGPDEIGNTITHYNARHRRPVRLQSNGWRYLDAGETVQAGDEAAFNTEPIWRPALEHFFAGYAIRGLDKEHSETFRRKLPANQGG